MKKSSVKALALIGLLFLIAIGGYVLVPDRVDDPPVKILLPNSGGRVVFGHKLHVDALKKDSESASITCAKCHHDLNVRGDELLVGAPTVFACADCHGTGDVPNFIQEHQERFFAMDSSGKTCIACHHVDSLPESDNLPLSLNDIAPNMQSCSSCHENMVDRMSAFHEQCMKCHDTMSKGPGTKAECAQCHIQ